MNNSEQIPYLIAGISWLWIFYWILSEPKALLNILKLRYFNQSGYDKVMTIAIYCFILIATVSLICGV